VQDQKRAHSHRIIGSAIYDGLVILGLLMIVGFLAVGIHYWVTGAETIENSLAYQIFLLLVIISYFLYFWRASGQTVGMKAWRIKLVNLEPNPIKPSQMALRLLMAIPAYSCLFLGVLWQYWGKSGLNWHDIASKTKLIYLPKR